VADCGVCSGIDSVLYVPDTLGAEGVVVNFCNAPASFCSNQVLIELRGDGDTQQFAVLIQGARRG